jgi:putative protein-disulfide isomerase
MKIIYFYDALCGWCYGFSDVMVKLKNKWEREIEFETISGGMISGERVGPLNEMAPYIKSAYKTVEERTGVKFGDVFVNDVLQKGEVILSSEPPSRALTTFKFLQPENSVDQAHEIQHAFYFDGHDLNKTETYRRIATKLDIDADDFSILFESEQMKAKTEEDFYLTQQFGITGFPAVVAIKDNEYFLVARGYTDFEQLDEVIQKVKNGIPASQKS